ncbi:MAG: TatD family hydrolase [Symbiopectobacterium sp.]
MSEKSSLEPTCESEQVVLAQKHPNYCRQTAAAERILQLAQQLAVVALGGCGLDFNHNFSTPDEQKYAFSARLSVGRRAGVTRPIFLHCRAAHERFIPLLSSWPTLGC